MSKRQRTDETPGADTPSSSNDSQPIKFTPVQTLLFSLGPGAKLTESQLQVARDALAEHDKNGNLDRWTVRNLRAVLRLGTSDPLYWEAAPSE